MSGNLPPCEEIYGAIDAYLRRAYPGEAPAVVRARVGQLRDAGERLFGCSVVERDCAELPTRYSIRLGNVFYPHMKLSIDRRPDGLGFLFRADTHDGHICPQPGAKEFDAFTELMRKNRELAAAIEADWEGMGLLTFQGYLKKDIERRVEGR
jgi:hypothetical protein